MASLRKRGRVWYYRYVDADGVSRERKGCTDRRATEELARAAESEAAKIKGGLVDPRDLARREHQGRPIEEHLAAYKAYLEAKGSTPKHVALTVNQARKVFSLAGAASLSDLSVDRAQDALKALRDEGLSLGTVNSHRTAARAFSKWAWKSGRLASDPLAGVTGYNAKEDRRHDRRTLGLDELRKLIGSTHSGPAWRQTTGPGRALCYRLAVATGLRYGEIQSITPESFDWRSSPPTVTVAAGYTKNGEPATLPLSADLAEDLARFIADAVPGEPVFRLRNDRGAAMLRTDLARAGIAYRDAAGLVYDFHALRCQLATNADAAGISPRVVQRLMRHSTLELTGRYTRPRTVDVERAALSLPSLQPSQTPKGDSTEQAATGTDGPAHCCASAPLLASPVDGGNQGAGGERISEPFAHHLPMTGDGSRREPSEIDGTASLGGKSDEEGFAREKPGLDDPGRPETADVMSAPRRTRTYNKLIKSQLLYQLS